MRPPVTRNVVPTQLNDRPPSTATCRRRRVDTVSDLCRASSGPAVGRRGCRVDGCVDDADMHQVDNQKNNKNEMDRRGGQGELRRRVESDRSEWLQRQRLGDAAVTVKRDGGVTAPTATTRRTSETPWIPLSFHDYIFAVAGGWHACVAGSIGQAAQMQRACIPLTPSLLSHL